MSKHLPAVGRKKEKGPAGGDGRERQSKKKRKAESNS